jgi:hypothetical protein
MEMCSVKLRRTDRLTLRPRLSIRTAFAITLIAGIYFACGRATKARGEREVALFLAKTEDRPAFKMQFVAPFLYRDESIINTSTDPQQEILRQSYYCWFFGFIGKLPFETHRSRTVAATPADLFEETYFPIRSSTSRHRTAVPVQDWRMQRDDNSLVPAK